MTMTRKYNEYPIGIIFKENAKADELNVQMIVNPIRNKDKVRTFEIPNDTIEDIISGLQELCDFVKAVGVKSLAIENLNCRNNPKLWPQIRSLILFTFNHIDTSIIVCGKGETIEKPNIKYTDEDIKNYKRYLKENNSPHSSFEKKFIWTNDIIIRKLTRHRNDLNRVIQTMFIYEYARAERNKKTNYPECQKKLIEHILLGLKESKK